MEEKNSQEKIRVGAGVGVCILKDGKVLMGKRKGSHSAGSWNFPGGRLEFKESIFDCATREAMEEAGVKIKNLRIGPFTNDIFEKEKKHDITVFVVAEYDSGNVEVKEPEKCEEWRWFDWNNLPQPLFTPQENLLKLKFNPFTN